MTQVINRISKKNKMLYINCLNKKTLKFYDIKLEAYMYGYMLKYFDIVSIYDIDNINLKMYNLVLINATCFKYNITEIDKHILFDKLNKIKNITNIVVFLHDLHDYSFNIEPDIVPEVQSIDGVEIYAPILQDNNAKKFYDDFFQKYNINHLISLYDCPEYEYFVKRFTTIKKFFLVNHGYPNNIFKPISCHKEYDVLFYGKKFFPAYPLRHKLFNIFLKSGLRFKVVKYRRHSENILCDLINKSWMCISCVSNFSYFVRKYLEISACNALILGNINQQGYDIIGSNMIYVNNEMTKKNILKKTKFYIDNKEIIAALSFNKLNQIEQQKYEFQTEKIGKICDTIVNDLPCEYSYNSYKNLDNNVHKMTHEKLLVNIDFIINENNLCTISKITQGLYVFVCDLPLNHDNLFNVYDDNNNLLSRRDTYVSDVINPDVSYIPFKINSESFIRINGITDVSKIKLYNIVNIQDN